MTKEEVTGTATIRSPQWSENNSIDSIMKYVRHAKSDEDAIHNLKLELQAHEKRLTTWQLLKLLLKK